jgi:hypothetical protein
VPSIFGRLIIFAVKSTAKGLEAWRTIIAGISLSYGSTETDANSRATGLS